MLFDTAPEDHIWERNAKRLRADIGSIEMVQLSHWHRDHSGGMLKAVSMINQARLSEDGVIVDLHPNRPTYRGFLGPAGPVSLEADPTFAEIEAAGATVMKNDQPHTVLDDMFLVSGEIPRVTPYEVGFKRGMRFNQDSASWESDELIQDERFLMCNVKGTAWIRDRSIAEMLTVRRKRPRGVHGLQSRWSCQRGEARLRARREIAFACGNRRLPSRGAK